MGKKKRRKVKKTAPKKKFETIATRKTIIILGVVGVFLVGLLTVNAIISFRKLETKECVEKMVFLEEMMRKMAAEFQFSFPPEVDNKYIIRSLVLYYLYGDKAFDTSAESSLRIKAKEAIEALEPAHVLPFRYLKCAGGDFILLPSKREGLYDVECTKHGLLKQPNEQGKYEFTGDIFALSPDRGPLGWEAKLYFRKELKLGKEFVTIVPAPQKKPTEKE